VRDGNRIVVSRPVVGIGHPGVAGKPAAGLAAAGARFPRRPVAALTPAGRLAILPGLARLAVFGIGTVLPAPLPAFWLRAAPLFPLAAPAGPMLPELAPLPLGPLGGVVTTGVRGPAHAVALPVFPLAKTAVLGRSGCLPCLAGPPWCGFVFSCGGVPNQILDPTDEFLHS